MTDISTINLTKDGSKVVVIGGHNSSWESFRKYSQIEFWTGEQKDIKRHVENRSLPFGTKLLIISRFISHSELDKVMKPARDRGIPIIANKADGEIAALLDELTKELALPIEDTKQRGKLQVLIPRIDFTISNTENAKKLFEIAKELNIKTTIESIGQLVSVQRRKKGLGSKPNSLRSKLDVTVEMFDNIIHDLSSVRDYIIAVNEENRILRSRMEKYKAALKVIED